MKKYLMACVFALISQAVWADCNTWRLEVINVMTKEIKTYRYFTGDKRQIPIQGLKKYECIFEVSRGLSPQEGKDHAVTATLICASRNTKDSFSMTTGSTCFDSYPGHGLAAITGGSITPGKIVFYDFNFSSE